MPSAEPGDPRAGVIDPLHAGVEFAGLTLGNRLALAPMTRVSATADGHATPAMADYYEAFATGGFGLLITEGIYTDRAFAQGYFHQPGLVDAAQTASWRHVTDRVHRAGGKIVAQLMHAGALSQGNPHRPHTAGPSAVAPIGVQLESYRGSGPYPTPHAMTAQEIADVIAGFAAAARLAREAGFDGVEVHAANGYLLDQFLTARSNRRDDRYGGTVEARLRLTLEVIEAIRTAGSDWPVGVRLSQAKVNDPTHRWAGGEADAVAIFSRLGSSGASYIHTTEPQAWRPAFAGADPSFAALAKRHSGLAVIANGSLHEDRRAEAMVMSGEADLVAFGRAALADHDLPLRHRERRALSSFDAAMLHPVADLANAERFRLA